MSIRSEAMATTYRDKLSYQLQDILHRNGMQAQVTLVNDKFYLLVKGHDSPVLEYPITEKQLQALSDSGTNYANKKAYNTFNNIVRKDFDIPSSFVAARNVNGRVAMGLHGYREQYPRRGLIAYPRPYSPGYLGIQPAMQDGFHLRRIGNSVMVPEHYDGRIRPGELKSGAYGYYYKGHQHTNQLNKENIQSKTTDPLEDLKEIFVQVKTSPRPNEPAHSYKDLITSPVYFTNEKWQEVLSSHGIILDESNKTMTVLSKNVEQDFVYSLNDQDLKKLTDNSLKSTSLDERLSIINKYTDKDFKEKVSMDMLNSKKCIAISAKPESIISIKNIDTAKHQEQAQHNINEKSIYKASSEKGYVNGENLQTLNEKKGWYREGKYGREVNVGEIWVEKNTPNQIETKTPSEIKQKGKENEVTYKMSAVINGNVISHDISKRQYEKFMAVDDYQRQRMMSKIFKEVDMKTRPEMKERFNIGAFLAAGLHAVSNITYLGADIAHNISHIKNPHPVRPEIHHEIHGGPNIFYKPGVDNIQDIAKRAYDAGVSDALHNNITRGR